MSSLQERLRALSPQKRALLARRLAGAGSETRRGIPPVERTAPDHPLSLAQERMWFLQRQAPESAAYNLGFSARGTIDPVAFRAELTAVVARHEAWRTTFHLVDGAVRQRVHAPRPVELPVLAAPPGVDADAHFEATVRRLVGAPFDLAEGPLYRFALVATGEAGVYRFIGVVHHIVFDSAAVQILLGEIGSAHATLAAGGTLPPLPVQYIDHAYWERAAGAAERARQVELYRQRLAGAPGIIELATDRPRPPRPSGAGGAVPLRFDAALTAALKALGAEAGATLYTVLLGAWAVLLQRHGAGDDLVIGAPVATRGRPELRGLLGLLVNTVPLRVTLAGDDGAPDYRTVLARLGEVVREALTAPEVPLGPLCDALGIERSPARHPLFQVIFDLHVTTTLPPGVPVEADSLRQHVAEGTAKFELSLILAEHPEAEGATIAGRIEYSADLFDHGTVAAMASQLEALLRAVTADATRPIDRLALMDPATRAEIIRSRGRSPFAMAPPGAYAETVVAQFAAQAAARPDAVAVSMLDADGARTTLSYGALDARANQVAAALIARGAGPGAPVALCLERSPALVIGLLGILKAGAAYLPMEPAWPWPRMRAVMRDAGVRLAVTEAELLAAFDESVEAAVVLDRQRGPARCPVLDAAALDALPATAPDRRPAPADLAYCIYTSGSTGEPKGVQVTHHNVIRLFAASAAMYGFTADDVWSGCHAFTFDVSVFELWGALAHGAEFALVPHLTTRSPRDLHRVLAASRVTMLSQTPSALAVLAPVDAEAETPLPLRAVVLAGEAFEPRRFAGFLARYGERARVVNMYGITETTVHSTWRRITLADAAQSHSPIGAPLADTRLHLLDDHLEPVPTGAPGELWVGGDGVSRGYLGRPALTAARFVDDPFDEGRLYRSGDRARYRADGELEYLGRRDAQIKIHGFRVETGEIEAALMTTDAVRDAAVGVHRDTDAGGDRLVAWVVAEQPLTAATLRAHLQRTLPDYMLPHAFVMLDALPLTANGKLDRRALPAPDSRRPVVAAGYLAPEGPLEAALAALWQGVLKLERVGRHDNFFELGGDSIKGAIMVEQLTRQSGAIIPVMVLFDVQTIAGFADWLTQNTPEGAQRMAAGGGGVPGATLTAGGAITADDIARFRALVPPFAPRRPTVRGRRVIIVLTPPRSGSTLLRVMLGGHPALFSPPELELLGFATLAERADTLSGRLKHWREGTVRALMALSDLDADAAFAEMARLEAEDLDVPGFYAHLQGLMGARTLVDKTASYPLDVAVMAAAERYFEDPLYIHLHRHPVDGVSSFLSARIDDMGFFRAEHPFDRAQLAELVWTVSHQNIARFLATVPAERQIRVGYEALVQDPVGQIERLCRFIGVEVAPAMLDPYTDKTARMTDGVHPDAGWMLGDIKFHHYTRIEASSARRWQKAGVEVNLGAPTWAVAEALGYRRPVARSPLLVPLAEGPAAEHAPLWCVHPVGGHVFAYRALARALGAERPVYGIRAETFAGVDDPATTIEEMARRYLEAIRAAQPAGPYLLAGWSLGGVVAYEMAQQLTAAGEAIGALVLIDSATPGRGAAGPAALVGEGDDPLAWMGLDLAGLGGEELPALIEAMRRMSPAERRAHLRERIEGSEIARRLGETQRARLVQVFRDNLAALARYRPAPYVGDATLLRAARRVDPSRDTDGWGALVARLRVLRVPGHHYSMLQPPHVAELARLVSAALPAGATDAR